MCLSSTVRNPRASRRKDSRLPCNILAFLLSFADCVRNWFPRRQSLKWYTREEVLEKKLPAVSSRTRNSYLNICERVRNSARCAKFYSHELCRLVKRDACVPTLGDDTIFSLSFFFSLEVNKLRSRVWFLFTLVFTFFSRFEVVVTHLSGV